MADKVMTLRLPGEHHQALKTISDTVGTSINFEIRLAIAAHLRRFEHEYKPTGSSGMRYCIKCQATEADPNTPCPAAEEEKP